MKEIEYNIKTSKKLGWNPGWFGAVEFDETLINKIKNYQITVGISPDGMVGVDTFRRIYTDRISDLEYLSDKIIIDSDTLIDIPYSVNHVYNEEYMKGCYRKYVGKRKPMQIVTHWDATLSAEHCVSILKKKKISTHFIIDNDGEIYQLINCNNIAWHAAGHNNHTIGIDFSNAFYEKYNDYYTKKIGSPRPVISSKVHGTVYKHLGYYPEQLESYAKLLETLLGYYNIPASTPPSGVLCGEAVEKKYRGVVSHYHLTENKIDCAGLDIETILENIREKNEQL